MCLTFHQTFSLLMFGQHFCFQRFAFKTNYSLTRSCSQIVLHQTFLINPALRAERSSCATINSASMFEQRWFCCVQLKYLLVIVIICEIQPCFVTLRHVMLVWLSRDMIHCPHYDEFNLYLVNIIFNIQFLNAYMSPALFVCSNVSMLLYL